jgi:Leucine-rich repeat (LRR) protein
MLDGFLLLHSCNVKLPHEVVTSKLSSQHITDVREEDLAYFKNLTFIDLSDNQVNLEWLRNLESVEEIDLQNN